MSNLLKAFSWKELAKQLGDEIVFSSLREIIRVEGSGGSQAEGPIYGYIKDMLHIKRNFYVNHPRPPPLFVRMPPHNLPKPQEFNPVSRLVKGVSSMCGQLMGGKAAKADENQNPAGVHVGYVMVGGRKDGLPQVPITPANQYLRNKTLRFNSAGMDRRLLERLERYNTSKTNAEAMVVPTGHQNNPSIARHLSIQKPLVDFSSGVYKPFQSGGNIAGPLYDPGRFSKRDAVPKPAVE